MGAELNVLENLTNLRKTMTQVWLAQSWANVTLDPSVAETKPTFGYGIEIGILGHFDDSFPIAVIQSSENTSAMLAGSMMISAGSLLKCFPTNAHCDDILSS